jgi:hypothetical protein
VLHRHEEGLNLIRLPHRPARSGALGWLDVACRVVIDVFPGNSVDECPVGHRVDVAHRFGRQTTCHLLWNNAGLVPSNRCSRCVDRRLARIGNLTSRGGFALRDSVRPVGVYLAVAVALDPSFCERLPVEPQEFGFVEPLKAFAADPGDHVRVGIVFPVLPCMASIDGSMAANHWAKNWATVRVDGFTTRPRSASAIASRQACHASFLVWKPLLDRGIPFGAAEPALPLRTVLAYRAFHDATSSRSPAITT